MKEDDVHLKEKAVHIAYNREYKPIFILFFPLHPSL